MWIKRQDLQPQCLRSCRFRQTHQIRECPMLQPGSHLQSARSGANPGFVPPLIPTLTDKPPAGDGWLHEVKHDGYRTILVVEEGCAQGFTRSGHDWSARYVR